MSLKVSYELLQWILFSLRPVKDPFVSLVGRSELIFIGQCVGLASVTSDCRFVI